MADNGISSGASTFPEVDISKELNADQNKKLQVDSVSSDIAATKDIKDANRAAEKKRDMEKKDALQTLKRTILISAVIVAVAGAAFAITKKLKEK
ncbi:hypothetical protein Tsubulata_015064 [Turnera subulata]|uniref:Uncharacterized protein n=1 Tax=Turnera subulata TaxID=218843 RepID=A0A9Q0G094_9ROSI|nr:hypothetical protein Tsubulata_015064 [Turnera subulata]